MRDQAGEHAYGTISLRERPDDAREVGEHALRKLEIETFYPTLERERQLVRDSISRLTGAIESAEELGVAADEPCDARHLLVELTARERFHERQQVLRHLALRSRAVLDV